ncbi:MAG TPA: dihydrolipoamide acetyltransferase family protein, partial [Candidatus Binatia bacterium]|nr:dihydrolipoamide acetyltransferase family protein [Candidatus Binatia bacterium]
KAGDEVPVGQRIAVILAPGEVATPAIVDDPQTRPLRRQEGGSPSHALREGEGSGEISAAPTSAAPPKTSREPLIGRVLASPAAKRLAREKGVPLASIRGSGPEGSVLAQDVLRAAQGGSGGDRPPAASSAPDDLLPVSTMRRIVAQRMTQSKQSAPHFYVTMEIDMTSVLVLRNRWKESGEASIPSINDFVLHACASALKGFPTVNSTYSDNGIKVHAEINIGMAVALEEGLVVPVIRNADQLTLAELAARTRELASKAQGKKLFPLDYEGGTFTVSNLGMLGVDSFIAIINPPQCAILAVGRVAPRVVTDGEAIEIRSLMTATLSADHRIIDGAIAARFLAAVKQQLETAAG